MTATPPKVLRRPNFPRLKESAPRKGFLEDNQYHAIAQAFSELWFRAMLELAKTYGWRSAELKHLRCERVNLANRSIRLNAGETKNGKGRLAIMTAAVYVLLSECVRGKSAGDFVFTQPDGKPVRDFLGDVAQGVCCCWCWPLDLSEVRRTTDTRWKGRVSALRAGLEAAQVALCRRHLSRQPQKPRACDGAPRNF